MLSLKRRQGESITIRTESGEEVRFQVYKLGTMPSGRGYVQLSFDAPRSIKILRSEIDGEGGTR